ncbi:MAG: hypothetical protein CV089_09175 [Nitrospira sp. WS110]|nr:hypothetical protein [Nitrospira sp. WS110]
MPLVLPPGVQVIETTSQTVPDEPEFIGQAEVSSIVEIRPQVTGELGSEATRSHSAQACCVRLDHVGRVLRLALLEFVQSGQPIA